MSATATATTAAGGFSRPENMFKSTSKPPSFSKEAAKAKAWYDTDDAFNFYKTVWGGSCIHVGYYSHKDKGPFTADDIEKASLISEQRLIDMTPVDITPDTVCVDLGAGFGGTIRAAVKVKGCKGICVEISEKFCAEIEARNKQAGLNDRIAVLNRSFTDTGLQSSCADVVWSQEAFLHGAGEADAIFREISRILKPGGYLVFTDDMKSDTTDSKQLKGILERIQLSDMSSPSTYKTLAKRHGMYLVKEEIHPDGVLVHYSAIKDVLKDKRMELPISKTFADNMISGLELWQKAAQKHDLIWGYLIFRKD